MTRFDAPVDSVMYLDKQLKGYGLLHAIARVTDARKQNGLIVDYIGVSVHLDRALAAYCANDVRNAMRDLDDLRNQLRAAHAAVLHMMKGVRRAGGRIDKDSLKAEFDQLVARLKPDKTQ